MDDDPRQLTVAVVAGEVAAHLRWQRRFGVRGLPATAPPAVEVAPDAPRGGPAAQVAAAPGSRPGGQGAHGRRASVAAPAFVDPGALVLPGAPPAARPPALDGSGETLAAIRADLGDCTRCKLCAGRKNIVFGTGNPTAPLLFVGEGPGAEEDVQGEPFVGAAGQLLNRMIAAMGFARQDVYIANVVKCRPPGNRNPEPDEIAVCSPFLLRQVGSVRPKVIVTLGKFAAQTLLATEAPVGTLRGRLHPFVVAGESISLMPTYHPAYLLRTPSMKKVVWEDLQVVMAELAKLGVQAPSPPGP